MAKTTSASTNAAKTKINYQMLTKIYVDFNNADKKGRVRLNAKGTLDDIENQNIELRDGIEILLDDNDGLSTLGTVQFSKEENIWVAMIHWDKLR